MTLFVDTSVWSLALRRDAEHGEAEVRRLRDALDSGDAIHTTGIVLQELLQGHRRPRDRARIIERFAAITLIAPDREDHINAAELRNECRRNGVQVGTIDALLAWICTRYDLVMLSTDRDFLRIADQTSLQVWLPP